MSFGMIKRHIEWPPSSEKMLLRSDLFQDLLHLALEHVPVDEQYYLNSYPDVGIAVENGSFNSPRHHYVTFGYFEDRLPFRIAVDNDFYFRTNPDIKAQVDAGSVPSAQYHFERYGFKEGRLPRENWSLLTSPSDL
jgi:hypothetical protein